MANRTSEWYARLRLLETRERDTVSAANRGRMRNEAQRAFGSPTQAHLDQQAREAEDAVRAHWGA